MSNEKETVIENKIDLKKFRILVVAIISFIGGYLARDKAPVPENLPQGFWENVSLNGTQLHVELNAYHKDPHLGIQRVFVTLQDPDGHWIPICVLDIPDRTDTFECDVDIADYIGDRDVVPISFDVVATDGQKTEAPSGGHPLDVNDNSENQLVR